MPFLTVSMLARMDDKYVQVCTYSTFDTVTILLETL